MALLADHSSVSPLADSEGVVGTPGSSPFDRVPSEIIKLVLTTIFLSYSGHRSISKFRFPSTTCRVSRQFYEATMSTPILWSYLYLSPGKNMDMSLAHIDDRIESRSGVLPLDVFFIVGTKNDNRDRAIIEKVASCAARWRQLSPCLPYLSVELLDLLHSPAPQLMSFHIFLEVPSLQLRSALVRQANTQLRQLRLHNCMAPWEDIVLSSTLEDLSITERYSMFVNPGDIVKVLAGSSLRSLSLGAIHIWVRDIRTGEVHLPPSITLESLEVMEVGSLTQQDATGLFAMVRAPAMHRLALKDIYPGGDIGDKWDILIRKLWHETRFPALKEVTLGEMALLDDWLQSFLANLPDSMNRLNIQYDAPAKHRCLLKALRDPITKHFPSHIHHLRVSGLKLELLVSMVGQYFKSLESIEVDAEDVPPAVRDSENGRDLLERLSGLAGELKVVEMSLRPIHQDFCSLEA